MDTEWHHIVGVFTSPTSRSLYVDGSLLGTDNTSITYADVVEVFVGRQRWHTGGHGPLFFKGYIDDPRIYATALSHEDITELYRQRASLDSGGNLFVHEVNETAHKPLLQDYTLWEDGQVGSIGQWVANSTTTNATRVIATDP